MESSLSKKDSPKAKYSVKRLKDGEYDPDDIFYRNPSHIMFLFFVNTSIKVFLMDHYHSTDLEVHRNWMAITHNLPMSQWYKEATSEWTLDYPPFFAYFELALSYFADPFDRNILRISANPIIDSPIKGFMRFSVMVTDFLYYYGVYRALNIVPLRFRPVFLFCTLFNVGLIFVDSVHFQYNGFMFGILFLSITQAYEGNYFWSAFSFAVLLNFKHLFVYFAPAFGLYFLFEHCFDDHRLRSFNWKNFLIFGMIVSFVFGISLGPFILNGSFPDLLQRLFPFGRGLTHAYWAPNFWAIYNFADIFISIMLRRKPKPASKATSGLVKQINMTTLPNISAPVTIVLIISIFLIYIFFYHRKYSSMEKKDNFYRVPEIELLPALAISSFLFFLFGYHVHEKAVLMIVCPLTLTMVQNADYAKSFTFLTYSGYFSLFPLLYQWNETFMKWSCMITYLFIFSLIKGTFFKRAELNRYEILYFFVLIGSASIESFGPYFFEDFFKRLPFLPLLIHSLVCSVGVFYAFLLSFF